MPEPRTAAESAPDARYQLLRELGGRAHQLRAATRAADHYIAEGGADDRDTASWLMSVALGLAGELTADIDGLARGLRESHADAALTQATQGLRVRAHQLQAAARAADHFLDQETSDERDTGSWLIACARGLAERLATEIEDGASSLRRPAADKVVDAQEAALQRRVAHAATPVRGVA